MIFIRVESLQKPKLSSEELEGVLGKKKAGLWEANICLLSVSGLRAGVKVGTGHGLRSGSYFTHD